MIGDCSVLAIISARGGSKGVQRKNIREVAGKPLIAWTIEEAKKSRYIDRLILSSEDPDIISVARSWGCEVPFVRPVVLAHDDTPGIEPVLHAIDLLQEHYDYIVLLQPTSPLRQVADIDGCISACFKSGAPACVTVTEPEKSPYWMYYLDEFSSLKALLPQSELITRRQDLPKVYCLNGAVYIAKCGWLQEFKNFISDKTIAYIMSNENSKDIDTELDLLLCEMLIKNRRFDGCATK